jgi:hypothetical protein
MGRWYSQLVIAPVTAGTVDEGYPITGHPREPAVVAVTPARRGGAIGAFVGASI